MKRIIPVRRRQWWSFLDSGAIVIHDPTAAQQEFAAQIERSRAAAWNPYRQPDGRIQIGPGDV